MFTFAALLLLGLAPGIYSWWSSRKLLERLEDPLLPELVLAQSQRVGTVVGVAIGLGIVFARAPLLLLIGLVFFSVLAGGFPARRRIFEESWSLAAYLSHSTRFWLGVLGSFLLLAAIPSSMRAAGEEASLAVASGLGVAAFLWASGSSLWFRLLLRARPLDDAELRTAFTPVLERARCEPPLLFEADAPGGSWVNAFALPSLKRGGVLFTRGLLQALTTRETTAIFAHEAAHLEHLSRGKLALGLALVAVLALVPTALWAGPLAPFLEGWEWVWPLVLLVGLAARASRQQAHESESDLRALELCQDPEALIGGLTKLHALLRAPRRWDPSYEKLASHPSLARRIQAIRRKAGGEIDSGGSPEPFERIFRASDASGTAVLFEAERVHWLRGIPEDGRDLLARAEERRTIRYADLRELRLEGSLQERVLSFTDAGGKKTRLPVSSESVSELQSTLDRVDTLLGYHAPFDAAPTGRFWSLILLALGTVSYFSWGVILLAALAFARPAAATLLALGAGSLASAFFLVLRPGHRGGWAAPLLALLIALCGIACLYLGGRRRRAEAERAKTDVLLASAVAGAVLLLSLLGGVGALLGSMPLAQLHSWARNAPAFAIGLVGLAGALATWRKRKARAGALASLALAAAFFALGSTSFRERYSEDVFARPGAPLRVSDVGLEAIRSLVIPGRVSRLTLSPGASRVAAVVVPDGEEIYRDSYRSEVLVEKEPGALVPMRAVAFDFLDEDRLLVLDQRERRGLLELRTTAGEVADVVAGDLPLLAGTRVEVDGARGTWWLIGTEWDSNELVLIRGRLGSNERDELRVDLEAGAGSLVAVNGNGWTLGPEYDFPDFGDWDESPVPLLSWFLLSSPSSFVTEMKLSAPGEPSLVVGKSTLTVMCFERGASESRFFCSAADPESTSLWTLDPDARSWKSLGVVSGYFYPDAGAGYRELVLNGSEGPLLVDLERGTADRPRRSGGPWGIVTWSKDVVARATSDDGDDETTVTLYTLVR